MTVACSYQLEGGRRQGTREGEGGRGEGAGEREWERERERGGRKGEICFLLQAPTLLAPTSSSQYSKSLASTSYIIDISVMLVVI